MIGAKMDAIQKVKEKQTISFLPLEAMYYPWKSLGRHCTALLIEEGASAAAFLFSGCLSV